MFLKHRTLRLFSILMVISLLLPACASPVDNTVTEPTNFRGLVSMAAPVSGASLSILNAEGKVIYQSNNSATSNHGSFLVDVNKKLPADFRVVCVEANNADVPVTGLTADVRGYDSQKDAIYINMVTTMVSRYLDKNKGKTMPEAEAAVKAFLGIPQYVEIGSGLFNNEAHFSHRAFLIEASRNGGVNTYIDQLVAQVGNPGASHPFPRQGGAIVGVGDGGAYGYIADKLFGAAANWGAGKVMGWALDQAGLGSVFGGDSGLSNDIKKMQDTLNAIQGQLTGLATSMENMRRELKGTIQKTAYDTMVLETTNFTSVIQATQRDLVILATSNASAETQKIEKDRIKNIIATQILPQRDTIHKKMVGVGGADGLIVLWSKCISSQHRFITEDDYAQIEEQFNYFDSIQLAMMELNVEYLHTVGETETRIKAIIQEYTDNTQAQRAKLQQKVHFGTFVDTETGKMWLRSAQGYYSGAEYKTQVLASVYGSASVFDSPNTGSPFNTNNQINFEFNTWFLPTMADLKKLEEGYSGKNATEDWFVPQGAFYPYATLKEYWGTSASRVWTRDWRWDSAKARDVVDVMAIGQGPAATGSPAISKEDAGQICGLFPVRIPGKDERYYW